MMVEWGPLLLTFKLAAVTTLILAVIGIPFAWWLSMTQTRFKPALEALVRWSTIFGTAFALSPGAPDFGCRFVAFATKPTRF